MDHVILPRTASHNESIEVPLLTPIDYDGEAFEVFEAYPEQQGWGEREISEWKAIFTTPPPEFLGFLQRWLFFGFLHTAIGSLVPVCVGDFRWHNSCRSPVVTTVKLPVFIERFRRRLRVMALEDSTKYIIRVFKVHILVSRLLSALHPDNPKKVNNLDAERLATRDTLKGYILNRFASDPMNPYISMSIHLIVELFSTLMSSLHRKTERLSRATQTLSYPETGALWTLLKQNGWCPSDMHVLFKQFNTSGLLFLNGLAPPESPDQHQTKSTQQTSNDASHEYCGSLGCTFRQIPDANYKTRHIRDCCGDCGDFKAAPDEILERGNVPLIIPINESDESGEIHLVEALPTSRYIAISHVWSDGLGNPHGNSIPRCQLLRLGNLVRNLPECCSDICLFWLDTICVPPDVSNQPNAQQNALHKMRRIYEEASAVLVLDSWLLSNKLEPDSDLDNLTKIFASPWNRRLWTFQEGRLAKRLYFQFGDGAYELGKGMNKLKCCYDPILNFTLKPTSNAHYIALRGLSGDGKTRGSLDILSVFRTTRYRSTSVISDEALCLAAIVDFDISEIAKIRGQPEKIKHTLRMQSFWKMAAQVPRDLVFYEGKTLPYPGFRWAPHTLLRSKSNMMAIEDILSPANIHTALEETCAQRTNQGLLIQASGLVFCPGGIPLYGTMYIVDDCALYTLKPHLPEVLGQKEGIDLQGLLRPHIDPSSEVVAFICQGTTESILDNDVIDQGILACITEEKNGTIFVEKICNVHRTRLTTEYDQDELKLSYLGRKSSWRDLKVERKLGNTQSWCVD